MSEYRVQFGMPEEMVLRMHVESGMEDAEKMWREFREEGVSVQAIERGREKLRRMLEAHFREQLPIIMRDLAVNSGHATMQ